MDSSTALRSGVPIDTAPALIGDSAAFTAVQRRLAQAAATDATILLLGETGTGKGLLAEEIHRLSHRRAARFITANCAALMPSLIESELFGHERGAYTDAHATHIGRIELAQGGTLFLDEVGELSLTAQARLLRVLHERQFERLGSPQTRLANIRVIAATNRSLVADVRRGRFRKDLYYRLNVVPIEVPPLRDRPGDVALLTRHLVARFSRRYERTIHTIPAALIDRLEAHDWQGNVRELENVIERAVITSVTGTLELVDLSESSELHGSMQAASLRWQDVARAHMLRVLGSRAWRIEGNNGAAEILGLRPSTLRSRMQKLGITRVEPESTNGRDMRPSHAGPMLSRS